MRVQTKLISLLLMVSAIFIAGRYFFQVFEDKRMNLLFLEDSKEKNIVFDNILNLKGVSLKTLAYDYTYWDEMVDFLHDNDMSWAESNMDENTLKTYQADAIWVYKLDLLPLYSLQSRNAAGLKELPLPRDALNNLFLKERFCHFFVNTKAGLMEIRGATIHPTLDAERTTPPQGYFFAGRLWSEEYTGGLAKLIGGKIRISAVKQALPPLKTLLESNTIIFSRAFPGWEGKPAGYVSVEIESKGLKGYRLFSRNAAAIFIGFLISILAFVIIFLTTSVSAPLSMISQALKTEKPVGSLALEKDTSEFGDISRLISSFFKQKQELVKEIAERKKAEEAIIKEKEAAQRYIDIAGVLIIIIDAREKVSLINRKGREILGYKKEEIIAKNWFDNFIPEDERDEVRDISTRMLKGEIEVNEYFENHVLTKNGKRLVAWRGIVLKDEKGAIIGHLSSGEDITERRKAEDQQKLLLKDLEESNRIMVGRELKMVELKDEVNRLSRELGRPEPYSGDSLDKNDGNQ